MIGWMDRWMDGWMDRWMDDWMDGWLEYMDRRNGCVKIECNCSHYALTEMLECNCSH